MILFFNFHSCNMSRKPSLKSIVRLELIYGLKINIIVEIKMNIHPSYYNLFIWLFEKNLRLKGHKSILFFLELTGAVFCELLLVIKSIGSYFRYFIAEKKKELSMPIAQIGTLFPTVLSIFPFSFLPSVLL